jgi:hypothetical protein
MVTLMQLEASFGKDGATLHEYLNNKHRGGINNTKGNVFENFFAVYKIASWWEKAISPDEIIFSAQVVSFIDDLVIEKTSVPVKKMHYQVKDVQTITWLQGIHSLLNDFTYQHQIYEASGENCELNMVVSRLSLKEELEKNISASISSFTNVIFFSTDNSVSSLLKTNAKFKEKIKSICAISNPHLDTLEATAAILIGAWDSTTKFQISLRQIQDICYRISPNYLKGYSGGISPALATVFAGIEGFFFEMENGYFKWSYNDTDHGILIFPQGTQEYAQWENNMLQLGNVNRFEQLESFL